ncbi:hypothetical protein GCM10028805_58560 [Spirosoma harenae]
MNRLILFFTALGLVTTLSSTKPVKPVPQPVVVLELFTSQGCSSCPAADQALQDITKQASQAGKAVYGLSFHVDYWDRLGWKDPFSAKENTVRQRQYDRTLKTQTYTPQLVVNGRQDIVGGQRGRIEQAIQTIQKQPASEFIGVDGSLTRQANQVIVQYTLSTTGPFRVNVALVQKEARTAVKNGENGGRSLVNTNIVRQFKTIDKSDATGSTTLSIPTDLSVNQTNVLVYVQRTDNGQIIGAKML